jgi:hypothetical protein
MVNYNMQRGCHNKVVSFHKLERNHAKHGSRFLQRDVNIRDRQQNAN